MAGDPDGLFYAGMCFETGMELARSAESAIHYYYRLQSWDIQVQAKRWTLTDANVLGKRSGRRINSNGGEADLDELICSVLL
ncbi:MAG: hypothetical protein OXF08_06420 [Bacteroidetes bacterium]|nr:hypothetical protein [Bacteroidota bacterium]